MALSIIAEPAPEVVIVVPRSSYNAVVKSIVECGCFHPVKSEGELSSLARRLRGEVELVLSRINDVIEKIGGGVEASARIVVEESIESSIRRLLEGVSSIAESVERIISRLSELQSPTSETARLLELLRLYSFLEIDLEKLKKAKFIRAKVFRIELENEELVASAISGKPAIYLSLKGVEKKHALGAIIYPASLEEHVSEILRSVKAQILELPEGYTPIPLRVVEEILAELERLPEQARQRLPELVRASKALQALSELLKVLEATTVTRYTAFIRGYVDRDKASRLIAGLEEATNSSFTLFARRELGLELESKPPTFFTYPKPLQPIAELIETYGHPGPLEIVPLALTTITLPIIFGLMFPDMGHGLVLLLAGLFLYYRTNMRSLGMLAAYLGASAMVFGFLAGEFFGSDPRLSGWLVGFWEDVAHMPPPYETPVHPLVALVIGGHAETELVGALVMRTIFLALTLGSVLLMIASWLGIASAYMRREVLEVAESIGRSLAFTGVAVIFLGAMVAGGGLYGYNSLGVILAKASFLPIAGVKASPLEASIAIAADTLVITGLLVMLVSPILLEKHEGIGMRIISGFIELFDLLLLVIGNTASFVRIMGLMLAHSGLMFGFLILALSTGNIAAWAVVYALGNLLVLGLEALIASAHTLRLHFYEMYSKFYKGDGVLFKPASLPSGVEIVVKT